MNNQTIYQFDTEFGPVYLESSSDSDIYRDIDDEEEIKKVGKFEQAISTLKSISKVLLKTLDEISPNEATLEMGLKFKTKTQFFVISAGTDAEIKVTLKWDNSSKTEN